MLELKGNMLKKYDRSIPNVNFDSDETLFHIFNLVATDKSIYQYMGLLFLRLGFEPEDSLLFCNYDRFKCSFDCVLNNKECYKIIFDNKNSKIFVRIHNVLYGYDCKKSDCSEIGMHVTLGSYTYEYADGMIFTRYLSREKIRFVSKLSDYFFEFELYKPDEIKLPMYKDGVDAKYRLGNEDDIITYLTSSKVFTKSIFDIYKDICQLYIEDVSVYPVFIIKRYRDIDDKRIDLDLINLNYGKFESFKMTINNRTVFLDKDDNWSYEMFADDSIPVNFLMSSQGGMISCMFSSKKEDNYDFSENYIHKIVKNDIDITKKEILRIKRKVKEMFNERFDKNV